LKSEGFGSSGEFTILFKHSFELHFDELHRYAFTILKDSEKAKDAVQQVFIKWWNRKSEGHPENPKAYLYTAVYNHCLNEVRNTKVRERNLAERQRLMNTESTAFEDRVFIEELQTKIETSIDSLPPQCKRIFQMSRFEDKKYGEIALELNLSVKTIEVQMGKALKFLRSQLSEYVH
jgi:RNA polymerase sigma-70 factor (ECF subfamily)